MQNVMQNVMQSGAKHLACGSNPIVRKELLEHARCFAPLCMTFLNF